MAKMVIQKSMLSLLFLTEASMCKSTRLQVDRQQICNFSLQIVMDISLDGTFFVYKSVIHKSTLFRTGTTKIRRLQNNSASSTTVPRNDNDHFVIGNTFKTGSQNFDGIINRAYIKSGFISAADIKSQFMAPRGTSPTPCSYFIGMFPSLTAQDASNQFTNLMSNYDGQNVLLTNTDNVVLDTDGPTLAAAKILTISEIKMTTSRSINVEFWFKGTFEPAKLIVKFIAPSGGRPLTLGREINHMIVRNSITTSSFYNLTNVVTDFSATVWTYISVSLSYVDNGKSLP